uniref:Cyclin-like domain-containing protein n=1 Tax=Timema shepardi TaxID=629360 RepID=A0A7R9FVC2_TIMSH|nr:unnamed protein product [Timema shepardi]
MGNKNSCCAYSSPSQGHKDVPHFEAYSPEGEESIGNLQHISEREPEDCDSDPSLHPMAGTIFMERSKASIETVELNTTSVLANYATEAGFNIVDDGPRDLLNTAIPFSALFVIFLATSCIMFNHSSNSIKENDTQDFTNKNSNILQTFLSLESNPAYSYATDSLCGQQGSEQKSPIAVHLPRWYDKEKEPKSYDSTVSQPNLKNTVKCVALAIYYHIKNRTSQRHISIFDEKLHPLTRDGVIDDYDKHNPEHRQIYKFVRTLFNAAQLTAECAIITLVYLERLLTYAEVDITPATWKRIVLGAILLASKVWDDQAVWNVDYCQILKDITVEDMNELERQFLEMLQFNINVPSSVYAKYYFDLRTLAEANDLSFPSEPLSKDRAQKLEAMSRVCEDKVTAEALRNGHKKWSSVDNVSVGGARRSVAILS